MKKKLGITFVVVMATSFFTSCGDLQRKVEEKVDSLVTKTESIDSLINKGVDKLQLDSLIDMGSEKAKKLDTLIDKSTSKLDSLVIEKINPTN